MVLEPPVRMPALQSDNTINQCSLLNRAQFPELWFDTTVTSAVAIPLIVKNGVLIKYSDAIKTYTPTQLTQNILGSIPTVTTPYSLVQFLSGKGVANANVAAEYAKFNNILLSPPYASSGGQGSSGASYESIVDNYFVGTGSLTEQSYKYSTSGAPLITPTMFWVATDSHIIGKGNGNPVSILGNLINNGYLLSETELYNPNDFDPTLDLPPANTESLLYLISLNNVGATLTSTTTDGTTTTTITADQLKRRTTLEARNLRFFGAWLAEYCYYKSRYEWLLKKYFSVYTITPYTAPNLSTDTVTAGLFSGIQAANPSPTQYSSTTLSQSEYLRCLVYHMACLNTRMVDMRLLLGNISEYYGGVQTNIQSAINSDNVIGSNMDLTTKITLLNDSAAKVQDYLTEKDFREGVMEYNLEKNRYANILLGFYAFLNIVAVAMIIQIRHS